MRRHRGESPDSRAGEIDRRVFLQGAAAGAAALAIGDRSAFALQNPDQAAVAAAIPKLHDRSIEM
ncbi:MAG: twin-arginine translocation signal domain-containing protein, partial [Gemmatimonadales bacterium]